MIIITISILKVFIPNKSSGYSDVFLLHCVHCDLFCSGQSLCIQSKHIISYPSTSLPNSHTCSGWNCCPMLSHGRVDSSSDITHHWLSEMSTLFLIKRVLYKDCWIMPQGNILYQHIYICVCVHLIIYNFQYFICQYNILLYKIIYTLIGLYLYMCVCVCIKESY